MTSINAKKPAFRCPTFSVPSKSKEATHEEETEKKPLPKETCVLKKPTSEGIENSTDGFSVKENEEKEKNKEKPSADEVTATGDAKPLEQKKAPKKKPAFHIKAKEEETKDAGQIKKPKKVKAEKSASEPKEKKEKVPKTPKEPKVKKEVITKPPKEPKVQKETQPKPPALPVRSLTDEEYVAIFTAAIESAMAIDIEEWEPKESKPMVKKLYTHSSKKAAEEVAKTTCDLQKSGHPFKPVKLENKVTLVGEEKPCVDVQKDTKEVDRTDDDHNNDDEPENSSGTGNENGAIENNDKVDKENQGDEEEDNEKIDDEARDNGNGEENEVDENNNAVHDDNQVLDQDNESIDLVQNQNETTPEGSETNYGATPAPAPPACASPPIKKKKVSGLKKKRKLEPKSLSFQEETANTTIDEDQKEREDTVKPSAPKKKSKDTPVGDKIKKLKQMRKERAERKDKKSLDKCTKQKKVKDEMKKEKQPPPKPAEKKRNKKKIMQHRQVANDGTWVQCCNEECLKWRYLPDVNDPAEVPERWVCNMNTREDYNSCEKAEEKYDESEHIYTKFTEGSIVWAKMTGYPWWPAMIEMDPDVETYFEAHSMTPTYYHVVFFDDKVSRSWVKVDNCKLFTGSEEDDNIKQVQVKKGPSYKKEIVNAKKNAQKAVKYCLQERIELFGFAARYHGKWGNINQESIVNDLKKGSVSEKRKLKCKDEKKGKKRQRSVDLLDDNDERSEDLLEDGEIESVINNTESFLDNVEDVLHSLDSQLDDSDEDSDFNPDEILPKKSRKCESPEPEISSDTMGKLQVESDRDSKAEIKAIDREVEQQETQVNEDKEDLVTQEPVAQDKNINGPLADSGKESNSNNISDESDQIVPEKDQVNTNAPIKFDPEIFTMEIDDDSDVKVEKSSENKGKRDTGSAASRKRTKGKAFKAPAATEDKKKEKGSSGPKKKEKKLKSQKNEKNVIKSDSLENDGTDETGESELKLEGNVNPNESNQPVKDKTISSDNKLELRTAVPFISSQEKIDSKLQENNSNKEDSGDEFDLAETSVLDNDAIKQMSDRKSGIKLELRTAVPFISSQEKTDSKLLEENDNSMKEDSDDDFDLAETSMFDNDPVIEKVSHMEVVNVPVMQSQESDSDPFDMMEE